MDLQHGTSGDVRIVGSGRETGTSDAIGFCLGMQRKTGDQRDVRIVGGSATTSRCFFGREDLWQAGKQEDL